MLVLGEAAVLHPSLWVPTLRRAAKAVRRLVAVVRADSKALAKVQEQRRASGIPAHVRVEELICPLRAANGLPIIVPTAQLASLAALTPEVTAWQPGDSDSPDSIRSNPSPMPMASARPTSAKQRHLPSPQQPRGGAVPKVPLLRLGGSTAKAASSDQDMARTVSFAPYLHSQHIPRQACPRNIPQVLLQTCANWPSE